MLLVLCVDVRELSVTDVALPRTSIVGGASVYPFAQNILLAARGEDIGGVLTTALCASEPAVRELLGLPGHYAVACLLVLGRPRNSRVPLTRLAVEGFTTIDRFDGPALTPTEQAPPSGGGM